MSRHVLPLSLANLQKAVQGIRAAIAKGGWVMELREAKRSDAQNDAIHGLIDQILKQRPIHFGARMTKETYKAVFMHSLGQETPMLPNLDGDGYFPMGLRTSKLTVGEFSALIESILAWCAQEGLSVQHFEGSEGADTGRASVPGRAA